MTLPETGAFTAEVRQDGRAGHRTIASALAAVPAGARILIGAGTYSEQLRIERDVELVADGVPGSVRIAAPGTCLEVLSGCVTVRGVAFWQGQPKAGVTRFIGRAAPQEPVMPSTAEPQVAAVGINAGTLILEDCSISAATGLAVGTGRPDTRIEIRRTRIHRVTGGIVVLGGATGLIEDCEFSEWALDAVWVSRASSRVEVRRCRFMSSPGQAVYADKAATAIVEGCEFESVGAAVFVGDTETEALVRSNTARRCEKAALMVGDGARVVAEGNIFGASKIGILASGPGTIIEVTGGLLDGNETGLGVVAQARGTAADVEIAGGKEGANVGGRASRLELHRCRVRGATEVGALAKDGATLVVDGGDFAGSYIGVMGRDAGSQVTVRRAAVHDQTGPAISIGQDTVGEVEGNDVFDNAFPGIVTVGGRLRAFDNKVHGNQSNGIAIRGGADAVIEGNELWANALPAVTVVGTGTRATVRENTVRDNEGQGIYVYEGASGQVLANRLIRNGRAAITISDVGVSARVEQNVIEESGGPGLWVSDGATATLIGNAVEGASEAGIFVNGGARVEARENVIHDASIGVLTQDAAGSFVANRLVGNTAGSWCLIDSGTVTRTDNEEELLALPGWAAQFLDLGRYVLLALRVGAELDIPPGQVERLGSALSLAALAERLRDAQIGAYGEIIGAHLSSERAAHAEARAIAVGTETTPELVRAGLVAHLADEAEGVEGVFVRSTAISGIVEMLSVQADTGAGRPLCDADWLGPRDELFDLGEAHARAALVIREAPRDSGLRAFEIGGRYSGSVAALHLPDWCPQVLGPFGALVAIGDAERIVVVPIEDASIVYALPSLIGNATAAWLSAAWRLGPRLVWVSADRVDAFEIEVRSGGTVMSVRAPAALAALVARLPEPAERIPAGWETEMGMTPEAATRLLSVVRLELLARLGSDASQLPEITPRGLMDVASTCVDLPAEAWPRRVATFFDELVDARRELDRLADDALYDEVRPHLWIQLDREPAMNIVQRPIAADLEATLVISIGSRKRLVWRPLAARWGMADARLWEDAAANMLATSLVATSVSGPVRKLETRDHEGEAIGLLLDRLPEAHPSGYLVGLVHKGAAYVIELRGDPSIDLVRPFAEFLAGIYREAAKFDDELSSRMFWSRPDGVLVDLFDVLAGVPEGGLPMEFRVATQGLA